jgi:hypothetical protein
MTSTKVVKMRLVGMTKKQRGICSSPGQRVAPDPLLLVDARLQDPLFANADGRHSSYPAGTCKYNLKTLSSSGLCLQVSSFV